MQEQSNNSDFCFRIGVNSKFLELRGITTWRFNDLNLFKFSLNSIAPELPPVLPPYFFLIYSMLLAAGRHLGACFLSDSISGSGASNY
jgi:hypothetical protein